MSGKRTDGLYAVRYLLLLAVAYRTVYNSAGLGK